MSSIFSLIYQMYRDRQKPKTGSAPLSPEEKKLYDLYIGSMENPALKDNAAQTSNFAKSTLAGYSGLGWQSPKTFSGQVGYQGMKPVSSDAFSWTPPTSTGVPQSGTPSPGGSAGDGPSGIGAAPPAGGGSGAGGVNGGGWGGWTALGGGTGGSTIGPSGSGGAGVSPPSSGSTGTDPQMDEASWFQRILATLNAHPQLTAWGVSSLLGVPPSVAQKAVAWLQSKYGYDPQKSWATVAGQQAAGAIGGIGGSAQPGGRNGGGTGAMTPTQWGSAGGYVPGGTVTTSGSFGPIAAPGGRWVWNDSQYMFVPD